MQPAYGNSNPRHGFGSLTISPLQCSWQANRSNHVTKTILNFAEVGRRDGFGGLCHRFHDTYSSFNYRTNFRFPVSSRLQPVASSIIIHLSFVGCDGNGMSAGRGANFWRPEAIPAHVADGAPKDMVASLLVIIPEIRGHNPRNTRTPPDLRDRVNKYKGHRAPILSIRFGCCCTIYI